MDSPFESGNVKDCHAYANVVTDLFGATIAARIFFELLFHFAKTQHFKMNASTFCTVN
jgi:hypothetical protein